MATLGTWWGRPWAASTLTGWAAWSVVFVAAGYVGRATIIDEGALSLVWPAAGVAALFLAVSGRAWLPVLTCLGLTTFVVNRTTGASPALGALFVLTNLTQVMVFVALLRHWLAHVWGFGGSAPLSRFVDLGRLAIAASLGGLAGAALGSAGLAVVADVAATWSGFAVWWGRNTVGIIVITTLGLLVGPELARIRSVSQLITWARHTLLPRSPGRLLEATCLLALTALLYWAVFSQAGVEPLSFLLLVPVLWAGLRFRASSVAIYGIAAGGAAIWLTLQGYGPFAGIDDLELRALVVQVFVAMAVLTGLALAFSRDERERALGELAVAKQREAERAELLGAVLESMAEGVIVLDHDETIVMRNAAGHDMFRPAAAVANPDGTRVAGDQLPGVRALAGERIMGQDYLLRRSAPDRDRVVEVWAQPLPGDAVGLPRAMVMARDVTLDRDHREGLSRFAGMVAHDLQNPLTVVEGWTETLQDAYARGTVDAGTALPMLARVANAATHMRTFIADLLSLTLTRDQTLRLTELDIAAVARDVARLYEDHAAAPIFDMADTGVVWGDRRLLQQMLDNLISNAIKYVDPQVRPRVTLTATPRDREWLEVRIADNGIGIPEQDRDRVFDALHRSASHQDYEGTGLGLAICRSVVHRHGGTIQAESSPESGTTFVLTLPRTLEAHTSARNNS